MTDLLDHSDNRPKYTYQVGGILQHRYKINTLDDFVKLNEEDINEMEFGPKNKRSTNRDTNENQRKNGRLKYRAIFP
jgi:hypothetical protein